MEDPGRVYTISNVPSGNNNNINNNRSAAHTGNGTGTQSRFNFINIKATGSMFKRSDFYKRTSVVLCLLVLFLLIGLIILICKLQKSPVELCESDECLRSAANLKLSINFSVDPCDDFYKFSCGKWSDEHPNHGWYPTFSSFRIIDERLTIATLKFLKSNATDDEPWPVQGARSLFKSCLNTAALDALGYTVIHKYIKKVGLPPVPQFLKTGNDKDYKFDWLSSTINIKKTFAMDFVFNFAIDADIYNRTRYVLYLSSNLGDSPLPSPFKTKKVKDRFLRSETDDDEEASEKLNTTVKEDAHSILQEFQSGAKLSIKEIITVVVKNSTESVNITEDIMNDAIEILWNATGEILDIVNANDTNIDDIDLEKYKISELQKLTDTYFASKNIDTVEIWKPYLEGLFKDSKSSFDFDNDYIFILKSEFQEILELVAYASSQPPINLELYFWWKVVESMIAGTTSSINDFIHKHTSLDYLVYPEVSRSRSLECAQLVNSYMGVAVTYGIADKNFVNDTLPEVEQMLHDIKDAFEVYVRKMDWMDKPTKEAAIAKSKDMIGLIGFPDWLTNKTAIEVYYANITIEPTQFLENLMSIIQTYIPDMIAQYNEVNYKQWRTDPTVVNAFHYVADNSINVPMAILTFPIYHLGLEVLNYGAIGSVLGHELTHGFDNLGKNYDKEGNMIEWWTNTTAMTFDDKTLCFIDQYNNFKFKSLNASVNGRSTLGENLADNGGVHQAFNAYKRYVERFGEEKRLPGFEDYTNEQMFFIAFGSIWCEDANLLDIKDQLANDEHSPSYFRVIGALQNSNDFAKAFNCKKGSPMNPDKKKCRIW